MVHHDVTVTAPLNLPASMPEHASELYARNVVALLELMLDDAGALVPDRVAGGDDEMLVGVVRDPAGADLMTSGPMAAGRPGTCWQTSRSSCWPGSSGSR